jgi:hypothetical protein
MGAIGRGRHPFRLLSPDPNINGGLWSPKKKALQCLEACMKLSAQHLLTIFVG